MEYSNRRLVSCPLLTNDGDPPPRVNDGDPPPRVNDGDLELDTRATKVINDITAMITERLANGHKPYDKLEIYYEGKWLDVLVTIQAYVKIVILSEKSSDENLMKLCQGGVSGYFARQIKERFPELFGWCLYPLEFNFEYEMVNDKPTKSAMTIDMYLRHDRDDSIDIVFRNGSWYRTNCVTGARMDNAVCFSETPMTLKLSKDEDIDALRHNILVKWFLYTYNIDYSDTVQKILQVMGILYSTEPIQITKSMVLQGLFWA